MKVQALKFVAHAPEKTPLRCYLEIQNPQDLTKIKGQALYTAYIVQSHQLESLRVFQEVIVDRGNKHAAKGLSKLLLGFEKVPLIDGRYRNPGQLKRSVHTLLENAAERGDQNIYMIGVEDSYFSILWDEAGILGKGNDTNRMRTVISPLLKPISLAGGKISSHVLLSMLSRYEEPPDLAQRYVGSCVEVHLVRQLLLRAAQVDDTVLILGDTGTGKEVVARAIHDYSNRRRETFISVNCGGIPRELLESELFGYEKGAFTGAVNRKTGLWQMADRGTLFLDEIGDLCPEHQVKILRTLEDGKIRPVGSKSKQEIQVNARIIAATNRDLYSMVKNGQFREDLYYRLREFLIHTPALRNHLEDIPVLASLFWKKITQNENKTLPQEILKELKSYRWPGNARELRIVLTCLRTLFGTENLRVDHLRAVFLLQGQISEDREDAVTYHMKEGLHKVECLSHLRRVDDVIRASEIAIRPVLENSKCNDRPISEILKLLRHRLNELEVLCFDPLLFHSEALFSDVNQFKGKISYFQNLLQQNVKDAQRYGNKDVSKEFKQVLKKVSDGIRLLQTEAS